MATAPATRPSIKVTKQSPYKGGQQLWSNRHHFANVIPGDLATWTALFNLLVPYETAMFSSASKIVQWTAYLAGSEVPIHTVDVDHPGTFDPTPERDNVLEACMLLKWTTDQRTSKNHPIYLFSYYHAAQQQDGQPDHELVQSNQRSNALLYAEAWQNGFAIAGGNAQRCGPYGAVALASSVPTHVVHRDFPR